jgi:hypothetical protein
MKLIRKQSRATKVVRTELADLIAAITDVLPAHVPMTRRPDPTYPEDVLLAWRPQAEGASILDVGWQASGIDIQIGFSSGYFDLFGPVSDRDSTDARLRILVELAEAIALGRIVAFTETTGKTRVETTVIGCRSGPQVFRAHERMKDAADTYTSFAPW